MPICVNVVQVCLDPDIHRGRRKQLIVVMRLVNKIKKAALKDSFKNIITQFSRLPTKNSRLYSCHINHKPIPHIAFQHSFIGFIYFIHAN